MAANPRAKQCRENLVVQVEPIADRMPAALDLAPVMAPMFTSGSIVFQMARFHAGVVTGARLRARLRARRVAERVRPADRPGGCRIVDPAQGAVQSDRSSEAAELAARPILPASQADERLKTQANFWNALCLTRIRE